ncbi:stress response kinase A [Shewanella sp. NFH-SH190041]|uniref:serine/threonine protein kinase n=1 Tax=Shewanella sp. NFH-SH190041 TaxID=2950245 RepID=UPI0021C27377|nr:serine/threonine protein kinase [Shewanella sp. NFH-SH190041]BDM66007.1 stress response kinase A [Shewanella sp. NFH-SH190041]
MSIDMNQIALAVDYHGLTPDVILTAIESLQIYPETGLLALNSYENRVYQFRCDRGQRYVVKFYRPGRWTDVQILEEHSFTQALAEAEVPVAAPVVVDGTTLHFYQGYRFALFPSIGGRQFEVDNLTHLEQVGRFIGRIHQLAGSASFQHRITMSPALWGRDAIAQLRQSDHVPQGLQPAFFQAADALIARVEQCWPADGGQLIRLHGDLHPGNILWTPDGPGFVDLDDACMGPAVQDIWMMLSGERTNQLLQLDILLEGYEEFCDFDTRQLALIEPLRAMRMLHHCGWISRRWEDPAFPMYFPWFAEQGYWQQQTAAFVEQLQLLDEPPLTLSPMY